jgi:hypothetical protein
MSKVLISNGYVVTVDGARRVLPGGYVAIDGARISARRRRRPGRTVSTR